MRFARLRRLAAGSSRRFRAWYLMQRSKDRRAGEESEGGIAAGAQLIQGDGTILTQGDGTILTQGE